MNLQTILSVLYLLLSFVGTSLNLNNSSTNAELETSIAHPNPHIRGSSYSDEEPEVGDIKHHMFFYELANSETEEYRAICGGSIITSTRVLTSSYCFYTNAKRKKRDFQKIRAVAAVVLTVITPRNKTTRQWRRIKHVYLQMFYRYPAYSLALVEINEPWVFNDWVSNIPYASVDQDFNGICSGIYVKAFESWSKNRKLYRVPLQMVQTYECEQKLVQNTDLFQCTAFDQRYDIYAFLALGSGLVCYRTGDPNEKDTGILIGVTVQSNNGLPTFHHKVALFHKWIKDGGCRVHSSIAKIISLCLSLYYSLY